MPRIIGVSRTLLPGILASIRVPRAIVCNYDAEVFNPPKSTVNDPPNSTVTALRVAT